MTALLVAIGPDNGLPDIYILLRKYVEDSYFKRLFP
jgi:hypothetical protein